ncbi:MAG: Photosystem I P700 chlorophyll a apoprotein A2 [Bacteroidetes bacterium ADurb.Bin408]|nr:MAG: Photosystem I P700 chlorophyll a apoprotein A2 [Bacteroidetes bacterium ADurb.Bin408]
MFVELVLDKIIIGKTYAIKNIFYNFDKYDIREDAKPELDNIVNIMIENPKIKIELGSHTYSRGTHSYNDWLSQKRAESAVVYIISKGIDPSHIIAKGYGETELLNNSADGAKCSDEEHQMNRRTEFKITGVSKE